MFFITRYYQYFDFIILYHLDKNVYYFYDVIHNLQLVLNKYKKSFITHFFLFSGAATPFRIHGK